MSRDPDVDVEIMVREWGPGSKIRGVGYHERSMTLEVRFEGGARYRYGNVTLKEAAPLLTAQAEPLLLFGETPGHYLSRVFVRQQLAHPFVRVDKAPATQEPLL